MGCKKFMQDPMEVYVDDEAKLTLHGLQQHYVKLKDAEKNRKLFELLDVLEFNQVVIFVKSVQRCMALAQLLIEQNFAYSYRDAHGLERTISYVADGHGFRLTPTHLRHKRQATIVPSAPATRRALRMNIQLPNAVMYRVYH